MVLVSTHAHLCRLPYHVNEWSPECIRGSVRWEPKEMKFYRADVLVKAHATLPTLQCCALFPCRLLEMQPCLTGIYLQLVVSDQLSVVGGQWSVVSGQ